MLIAAPSLQALTHLQMVAEDGVHYGHGAYWARSPADLRRVTPATTPASVRSAGGFPTRRSTSSGPMTGFWNPTVEWPVSGLSPG